MLQIPDQVQSVMAELEARDAQDRDDGTPFSRRLRAIKPDVGRFLTTLIVATHARLVVEVGTSGGYSGLWFAQALRRTGGRLVTYEVDPDKIERATATFDRAAVTDVVEIRHGDGRDGLATFAGNVDLVFIDADKDRYLGMLPAAIDALRPGGLLVADNLVSHAADLAEFRDAALADARLEGVVVPIGGGELVAVKL